MVHMGKVQSNEVEKNSSLKSLLIIQKYLKYVNVTMSLNAYDAYEVEEEPALLPLSYNAFATVFLFCFVIFILECIWSRSTSPASRLMAQRFSHAIFPSAIKVVFLLHPILFLFVIRSDDLMIG